MIAQMIAGALLVAPLMLACHDVSWVPDQADAGQSPGPNAPVYSHSLDARSTRQDAGFDSMSLFWDAPYQPDLPPEEDPDTVDASLDTPTTEPDALPDEPDLIDDGTDEPDIAEPEPASHDFTGDYLLAVGTPAGEPILWAAAVAIRESEAGQVFDLTLQALTSDLTSGGAPRVFPREPVGPPVEFIGIEMHANAFDFQIHDMLIPADANAYVFGDMIADVTVRGVVQSDRAFCGTLSGTMAVVAPSALIALDDWTFGALQTTDVAAAPVEMECRSTRTVRFSVDDRLNQVYDPSAGLAWKGSFDYDPYTGLMTWDASWTSPPAFAMLNDSGHVGDELAGDHLWSVEARVEVPEQPITSLSACAALGQPYTWNGSDCGITFEYGAIRGSVDGLDGGWIWTGPNGTVRVTANASDPIMADPLVLPLHGSIDLRLELDMSQLNPSFTAQYLDIPTTVSVKGSHWAWEDVALLDGEGGDLPGDAIYTFVLSNLAGDPNGLPYDGLLHAGTVVDLIFTINGSEYLYTDGIRAYTDVDGPGIGACLDRTIDCEEIPVSLGSCGSLNPCIVVPEY